MYALDIQFLEKNKASLENNFQEIHQMFINGFEEEDGEKEMSLMTRSYVMSLS